MPQDTGQHTPDYPPKTPPPPKRPVQPPRPTTLMPEPGQVLARSGRRGVGMVNRRGANWRYESVPWAAPKASTAVLGQLTAWGYRPTANTAGTVEEVVLLLVRTAVADHGTRVSVHLADQDRQVCVLALSHHTALTPGHQSAGDDVLHRITTHRAVTDCGTDTGPDGRRLWAVITL